MSAETLNFGPQWLRELSSGGSKSTSTLSSPLSQPISRFKLAENRYGREEMLALFMPDEEVPEELQRAPSLVLEEPQSPLALTSSSENAIQQSNGYQGRGGGISNLRNRPPPGRGRGRGRGVTLDDYDFMARKPPLVRRTESEDWRSDSLRGKGDWREKSSDSFDSARQFRNRSLSAKDFNDPWGDDPRDADEKFDGRFLASQPGAKESRNWRQKKLDEVIDEEEKKQEESKDLQHTTNRSGLPASDTDQTTEMQLDDGLLVSTSPLENKNPQTENINQPSPEPDPIVKDVAVTTLHSSNLESTVSLPEIEGNSSIHNPMQTIPQTSIETKTTMASTESAASTWYYKDPQGDMQGPFKSSQMMDWFRAGYFTMVLLVRRACDTKFVPLGELIKTLNQVPFQNPPAMLPDQMLADDSNHNVAREELLRQQAYRQYLQQQQQQQQSVNWSFGGQEDLNPISNLSKGSDLFASAPYDSQQLLQHLKTTSDRTLPISQYDSALEKDFQTMVSLRDMNTSSTHSALLQPRYDILEAERKEEKRKEDEIKRILKEQEEQKERLLRQQEELRRREEQLRREEENIKRLHIEAQRKREHEEMLIQQEMELRRREEQLKREEEEMKRLQMEAYKKQLKLQEQEAMQRKRKETEDRKREQLELEARRVEDEKRQRMLEEQKRLETARKMEEESRRLQLENMRKLEEQRQEEARRKEEERLREFEAARQRELKRQEEIRQQNILEEKQRLELERQRKAEAEERRARQMVIEQSPQIPLLPATASWGQNQNIKQMQAKSQSLLEIQMIQETEHAKQRQEAIRMGNENQKKQPQNKSGWGISSLNPNHGSGKSLLEIQKEEERHMVGERKDTTKSDPVPSLGLNTSWNKPPKIRPDVAKTKYVVPQKSESFWDQVVEENKPTPPQQMNQTNQNRANNRTKKGKVEEEKKVKALFNQQATKDVFMAWCEESLNRMNAGYIDIPTFVNFLLEVQSPYEVQEYVQSYLGESRDAKEFAKSFLEKRSKTSPLQQTQSDSKSPIKPKSSGPRDPDGFQVVSSGTKRSKKKPKKAHKVDPNLLGFSVNAASDRVNMGEIEPND